MVVGNCPSCKQDHDEVVVNMEERYYICPETDEKVELKE